MRRLVGLIASALVACTLAACSSSGTITVGGSGSAPTGITSSSPSAATRSAATPTASVRAPVVEHADNREGVPVFAGATGAAAPDDVPGRIPYGTAVHVACYVPNQSGMSSINVFYRITGGPWDRLYAPANTFDNGAGMGPNSVNLDPRVRRC